jgi:cellulose biosynthesis protein BcsQ
VPTIPTPLSVRTFHQLRGFVADEVPKPRPRILAFFSMADGRKKLHRNIMEELRAATDGVLATAIPAASEVERMALHRRALAEFAPRGVATKAYGELWNEVQTGL